MQDWDFAWDKVRRRPGLFIGSPDENGLQLLALEILDNALAEAATGHADIVQITLKEDGSLVIADNGRGIPVDIHPSFPGKSAVEIVFTLLDYERWVKPKISRPKIARQADKRN